MIEFTQYLRPRGRKQTIRIERPSEIEAMAAILAHDGYVFECEELQTGHVSMTVERPGEDWPLTLAHEVCVNGPRVPETIDALITKAYERAKMLKG